MLCIHLCSLSFKDAHKSSLLVVKKFTFNTTVPAKTADTTMKFQLCPCVAMQNCFKAQFSAPKAVELIANNSHTI